MTLEKKPLKEFEAPELEDQAVLFFEALQQAADCRFQGNRSSLRRGHPGDHPAASWARGIAASSIRCAPIP